MSFGVCGPFGPVPYNAGNFGVSGSRHGLPLKTTLVAFIAQEDQPTKNGNVGLNLIRAHDRDRQVSDLTKNILYNVTYESVNAKWAFSLREGSSPEGSVVMRWQAPSRQSFFLQWQDEVEVQCKRGLLIHKTFKAEFGPRKYEWIKGGDRQLECHIDKELAATCTMLDDQECSARFEIKQAFTSELATLIASTLGVSEAELGPEKTN